MPGGVDGDHDISMDGDKAPKILTLEEELQETLSQEILSFTGNYYYAQLQQSAPNPCLSISGLGTIGLPLEEYTAKRIVSVADVAHGACGTLDKPVRGIWEVEPTRISFLNPAWDSYISETLCPEACTALGALTSAPKIELRKLLLYEKGAYHPVHQDLQGANNVFATVTLLLPSVYSGGEAVLSHASNSKTIDFSAGSVYSSAVLAKYTDIAHEVQPISSGYRLALSYNIIHTTASTEPCPSSPKTLEASDLLRGVLRKWRHKLDSCETKQYRLVYLLDHTYDLQDAKDVLEGLKGVDVHRVRILYKIAEELGFTLGVASLEYKYGPISEVIKESNSVRQLTGLDGKPLLGLSNPMGLRSNTIVMVPETAAKRDVDANTQRNDDPHKGGKRTVLLLIEKQRHDDFRFAVDGLRVAIQVFRDALEGRREQECMKWAKVIVRHARNSSGKLTDKLFLDIFHYALERRDLELWLGITSYSKWRFGYINTGFIFKAYKTFSFEDLRDRFDYLVDRTLYYEGAPLQLVVDAIIFFYRLSSEVAKDSERETVQAWCRKAMKRVLGSVWPSEDAEDAKVLVQIIKLVGMELSVQCILPLLTEKCEAKYFGFWVKLHLLLRDQRQDLLECLSTELFVPGDLGWATATEGGGAGEEPKISTAKVLDELIKVSLSIPSLTWSEVPRPNNHDFFRRRPYVPFNPNPQKIEQLLLILEACIRSDDVQACDIALEKALDMSGNPIWNFSNFYGPVITRLQQILTPLDQDLSHPLFAKFLRRLIGRYLSMVLGKRGPVVDIGLRKVSCDKSLCATCKNLDAFILSTQAEIQLRMDSEDSYNAEECLEDAIDLCTYGRLDNPKSDDLLYYVGLFTLEIKKHESVVQCSNWDYRLASTKALLASIGPDSVIEDIMGERYADVQSALASRRKFVWDEKRDAQAQVVVPATSQLAGIEDSSVSPQSNADGLPRALQSHKRKRV